MITKIRGVREFSFTGEMFAMHCNVVVFDGRFAVLKTFIYF